VREASHFITFTDTHKPDNSFGYRIYGITELLQNSLAPTANLAGL